MPSNHTTSTSRRPRSRGKPRYGVDEVVRRKRVDFDADQLSALAALLGKPELADAGTFEERLSKIATDYCASRQQKSQAPSRATINANLLNLDEIAGGLANRLEGMDIGTEMELVVARLRMGDPDDPRFKSDLIGQLRDLSAMLLYAHERSAASRGPVGNSALDRAVLRLAILFEEFAGVLATHNPNDNLIYDGRPLSKTGRFVAAVFAIVEPKINEQRLSTALMRAIKEIRPAR